MFRVSCVLFLVSLSSALGSVLPDQASGSDGFAGRIVGGTPVSIDQFPWTAVLIRKNAYPYCSGSIITKSHVITAAHCTDYKVGQGLAVRVGSSFSTLGGTVHQVEQATNHPLYNADTFDYDVAVLKLTVAITNPAAAPIALTPSNSAPAVGQSLSVAGWGVQVEGGTTGPLLLYAANVNAIARTTCNAPSSYNGAVTQRMICAAAPGKDSCDGDSGGPLVKLGSTPVLVGIVSWGIGCAQAQYPGVYTNVANPSIHNFITANIV